MHIHVYGHVCTYTCAHIYTVLPKLYAIIIAYDFRRKKKDREHGYSADAETEQFAWPNQLSSDTHTGLGQQDLDARQVKYQMAQLTSSIRNYPIVLHRD